MSKGGSASLVVLAVVALVNSVAQATSLMGPPTAKLLRGQFAVGAQYAYSSMCVDLTNGVDSSGASVPGRTVDNLEMNSIIASLGYGILDSWEGAVRLGAVDGEWDEDQQAFDGAWGLYIGGGTKVTVREGANLRWGGLIHVDWAQTEGRNTGAGWAGDTEVKLLHLRVAGGPTYDVGDNVSIYGGPFYQYINGDKDYREITPTAGFRESYDVEGCSCFGGYIGAGFMPTESISCNVETQLTGDDWVLGVALAWLLGEDG
jgi:opacity protein-like surface antigen